MELEYEFKQDGTLSRVTFTGLNGDESISTVKEALMTTLKVKNPASSFSERLNSGAFAAFHENHIVRNAEVTNILVELWRHPGESGKQTLPYMNVLSLLANSLALNVALSKKPEKA